MQRLKGTKEPDARAESTEACSHAWITMYCSHAASATPRRTSARLPPAADPVEVTCVIESVLNVAQDATLRANPTAWEACRR